LPIEEYRSPNKFVVYELFATLYEIFSKDERQKLKAYAFALLAWYKLRLQSSELLKPAVATPTNYALFRT
jgi:hypothetical protein